VRLSIQRFRNPRQEKTSSSQITMQKTAWVCDVCDEPDRYRRLDRNNKSPTASADDSAEIHPPHPTGATLTSFVCLLYKFCAKKLYLDDYKRKHNFKIFFLHTEN
jgi:hypothetical protein